MAVSLHIRCRIASCCSPGQNSAWSAGCLMGLLMGRIKCCGQTPWALAWLTPGSISPCNRTLPPATWHSGARRAQRLAVVRLCLKGRVLAHTIAWEAVYLDYGLPHALAGQMGVAYILCCIEATLTWFLLLSCLFAGQQRIGDA